MKKKMTLAIMLGLCSVALWGCKKALELKTDTSQKTSAAVFAGKLNSLPPGGYLGTGWTEYFPDKRLQLDTNKTGDSTTTDVPFVPYYSSHPFGSPTPVWGDYAYLDSGGIKTETFRLLDYKCARVEVRHYYEAQHQGDNYSTGTRQFEGFITIASAIRNECVMQILLTDPTNPIPADRYRQQFNIRADGLNGGTLKAQGVTIASGINDVAVHVNVIHIQQNGSVDGKISVYVDGVKKYEQLDTVNYSNYMKYGAYGTHTTSNIAIVKWQNVRVYKGSSAGSGGTEPAQGATRSFIAAWFTHPTATYKQALAQADFGNVISWEDSKAYISDNRFRANIIANQTGAASGVKAHTNISDGSEYEMQFTVRFHSAFDWGNGGKLGFGFDIGDGTADCVSGDGNGASVRLDWAYSGGRAYFKPDIHNVDQISACGDDDGATYPATTGLVKGTIYKVYIYVKSNTGSNTNGRVTIKIDDNVLIDRDIRWTTNDTKRLVTELLIHTYRNDSGVPPTSTDFIYFDDLRVSKLND